VIGHDPHSVAATSIPQVPLDTVWQTADWISLHHPAARGVSCVYGRALFQQIKPGAFLINVSRAGLVDSTSVLEVLGSGRLAGYAVDDQVFTEANAGPLIRAGRILQTGHSAWYSQEALDRGYQQLLENVQAMAVGRPRHAVNPKAWNL
jgi:phosphoglycerate dehydrogenase-like enzyme